MKILKLKEQKNLEKSITRDILLYGYTEEDYFAFANISKNIKNLNAKLLLKQALYNKM